MFLEGTVEHSPEYLDKINKRAYEIYLMRKHSPTWHFGELGTPTGDWHQAEKELRAEHQLDQ